MKRLDAQQINTKQYWNFVYGDVWKREQYDKEGTLVHPGCVGDKIVRPTARFGTALRYVKNKDKVIDLGCGVGSFTKLVKKTYPDTEVWGTDISDKAIEDNTKENPSIKYLQGYIGYQKFLPSNYFDFVLCGEVIEHLDDPKLLFKEAYRILKDKGTLIVTTPMEDHVYSEEHIWEFTKDDVNKFFIDAGFKNIKFVDLLDMEYLIVIFAVGEK
jgi:ubiquinone/menaquinone biosynthesis C-methylase UbiE